jgi:hypothetical protein
MSESQLPRSISFSAFVEIGFYTWLSLQQCALKAMSNNLALTVPLPKSPPTRAVLIGLFHHALMQHASLSKSRAELDSFIEGEISNLQRTVDDNLRLQSQGSVSSWSEVNKSAVAAVEWFSRAKTDTLQRRPAAAEQMLRSGVHGLVGRPDYFAIANRTAELLDFKSARLVDEQGTMKREYDEQLVFYAALLYDNFDIDQVFGTLKPLYGESVRRLVTRSEALQFAEAAKHTLARSNELIATSTAIDQLATPSGKACAHCLKQIICVPYQRLQYTMDQEITEFTVRGVVASMKLQSASRSIVRIADSACREIREIIAPNRAVAMCAVGDEVAMTGLKVVNTTFIYGRASRVLR